MICHSLVANTVTSDGHSFTTENKSGGCSGRTGREVEEESNVKSITDPNNTSASREC